MAIGTIRMTLDTFNCNHTSDIVVVRGDYGARFINAIIAARGIIIPVESSAVVAIGVERPDGETKSFFGSVESDGSVCVPLTQWMSDIIGRIKCTVAIVHDSKKISTTYFYIQVQDTACDDSEISADDPIQDVILETYYKIKDINAPTEIQQEIIKNEVIADIKAELTPSDIGAAENIHNQSASTITEGTFAGLIIAGRNKQPPSSTCLRNSILMTESSSSYPVGEGELLWIYK